MVLRFELYVRGSTAAVCYRQPALKVPVATERLEWKLSCFDMALHGGGWLDTVQA